jgi:long-chain acyl-CoA synthetase
MITASAPIADNVLAFLKVAFCCPIVEAYGQTESCGASFSTKLFDNRTGHVGGPALGVECMLRDVPDLKYTRESQPNPQGEVLLRGPSIFVGYFRNPTLTQETKDPQGWLHTGDVGELLEGNSLKIIDRIKNIFKLSQGEYIVSEKLERVYEQSTYVAQIFIHGDSLRNHIVAIAHPDYPAVKAHCE